MRASLHNLLCPSGVDDRSVPGLSRGVTQPVLSASFRSGGALQSASDHPDANVDVLTACREPYAQEAYTASEPDRDLGLKGKVIPGRVGACHAW